MINMENKCDGRVFHCCSGVENGPVGSDELSRHGKGGGI